MHLLIFRPSLESEPTIKMVKVAVSIHFNISYLEKGEFFVKVHGNIKNNFQNLTFLFPTITEIRAVIVVHPYYYFYILYRNYFF